jgi:glycosyltransferase involved in cell wall biosynthesis
MRVAVVVQRYGQEVNGGAEVLCREWAVHLAAHPSVQSVTVLTSCARDHEKWANYYPSGVETLDGVNVERFPVLFERVLKLQHFLDPFVLDTRLFPAAELAWFTAQGPTCPGLWRRLWSSSRRDEFDVYLFVTYLYSPTVFGLPLVHKRAVLAPTAHDEKPIRLTTFHAIFRLARAFAFLTPEERDFVHSRFGVRNVPCDVVGKGIEIVDDPALEDASRLPQEPYVLYVGRIEASKGFPRLFDEFDTFKRQHGDGLLETRDGRTYRGKDLKIVLAGRCAWDSLPERPDVVALGFVSELEKRAAYRRAQAFILPSRFESLSIVILEAWAQRCPVLVDGHCEVTAGQVKRAKGGATFRGEDDFSNVLNNLLSSPDLQRTYGAQGRAYVEQNYSWPGCTDRLVALLKRVAEA